MGHLGCIYSRELRRRASLSRPSRDRYAQIAGAYLSWLDGSTPTRDRALDYLADLRDRGCAAKSCEFFTHVVRDFHRTVLSEDLGVKVKRSKRLPPYVPGSSVERVLVQAERGLRGHSPERRERTYDARPRGVLACTASKISGALYYKDNGIAVQRATAMDVAPDGLHVRHATALQSRATSLLSKPRYSNASRA